MAGSAGCTNVLHDIQFVTIELVSMLILKQENPNRTSSQNPTPLLPPEAETTGGSDSGCWRQRQITNGASSPASIVHSNQPRANKPEQLDLIHSNETEPGSLCFQSVIGFSATLPDPRVPIL
ncbi:hypothetical protein MRB53_016322 [Persea americana]|uniref:Uncharacterized protein n=1 Tax=Persea americana TaxID=3435 RepID=A0ACC2M2D6_PERAE|nr:hypothetical protein MRB53_016322 [Persea americana]